MVSAKYAPTLTRVRNCSTGVGVNLAGERFDDWTFYFASGKLLGTTYAKVKLLQVKFDK